MSTNADKDPQTHDGTPVDANADKTPAGNVSTVTADTVILDQMKEMFASAHKKSDEQGKLVGSLAKQVETITAKARSKAPRGTTRARSSRRLDFETPGNRVQKLHTRTRLPQAKTLMKRSSQVHSQLRRTFHLLPRATKEKKSSASTRI
ncbi:hypothetical protein F2Q69_00020665 [Brassica cretica]|uniref:Uncharacterized protein n=1 Tax=Brassica cretica TaxID=69181 RepID=A0A8S9QD02_BRACR|nr:hypothetical protein F2Q69_00020665 [Brassica cretica]